MIVRGVIHQNDCSWCNSPDLASCGTVSDPDNWKLVRAIGSGNWFTMGDNLAGSAAYSDNGASSYNIGAFETFVPGYNQFLFISGDCADWVLASVEAVLGEYYDGAPRNACATSASPTTPSTPRWYHRDEDSPLSYLDPLVTPRDWGTSSTAQEILYVENFDGQLTSITDRNGLYVFARNAGDLDSVGCAEPDPCAAVNCESDEVCIDGECIRESRDCSALNIDEFLTDCSSEYEDVTEAITALKSFETQSTSRLDGIDAEIETITGRLDLLSAHAPGGNFPDYDNNPSSFGTDMISTQNKDLLIIGLLIINILMIIGGCIFCSFWVKSQAKYRKYGNVRNYESNDEQEKLRN